MICSECGASNVDTAKFCKACGSPLKPKKPTVNPTANSTINNNVQPKNSSSGGDNKKLILICATVIICIAIIAATFIMISDNEGINSDSNANANLQSNQNDNSVSDSSSSDNTAASSSSKSTPSIYIKYCDFYTGSSLSDKSYCSANIGTEHYGETYKIGVSYYNDGSRLNDGATATKTVDEEGFLHIYTSNAFDCYPDKATVDIYDAKGDFLTEETYYLDETSGQQKFGH